MKALIGSTWVCSDAATAGSAAGSGSVPTSCWFCVFQACVARKCYPSPLNYYNFPKSCCTSVNEVICHGIPDRRALQDGDILNGLLGGALKGAGGINDVLFLSDDECFTQF